MVRGKREGGHPAGRWKADTEVHARQKNTLPHQVGAGTATYHGWKQCFTSQVCTSDLLSMPPVTAICAADSPTKYQHQAGMPRMSGPTSPQRQ